MSATPPAALAAATSVFVDATLPKACFDALKAQNPAAEECDAVRAPSPNTVTVVSPTTWARLSSVQIRPDVFVAVLESEADQFPAAHVIVVADAAPTADAVAHAGAMAALLHRCGPLLSVVEHVPHTALVVCRLDPLLDAGASDRLLACPWDTALVVLAADRCTDSDAAAVAGDVVDACRRAQFSRFPLPFWAHETSVIDPRAEIGARTKVWHFSQVMRGARVGEDCAIGQNVVVHGGSSLGRNVRVQNNVSVYACVHVEDNCFLGPSMVFTNDYLPRSGKNDKDSWRETILRTGSSVGANATVVCGVTIGAYATVGAGAVVTRDVQPNSLVFGSPARHRGWVSHAGEKLDLPLSLPEGEEAEAVCPRSGDVYKLRGTSIERVSGKQ